MLMLVAVLFLEIIGVGVFAVAIAVMRSRHHRAPGSTDEHGDVTTPAGREGPKEALTDVARR